MLKSSSKNVFHCTVCGHLTYVEDSVETPKCCGQSMYLACKAQKPLSVNRPSIDRLSTDRSVQNATKMNQHTMNDPPAP